MSVLVVIPARGGSKGVPRKNLREVAGVPLVGRTVATALAARRVDRVVVSTDDEEIMDRARAYGAETVRRPREISGDAIMPEAAVVHALGELERDGYRPDITVMLQNTAPLALPDDIDGAIDLMLADGADSVFAAARFFYFLWGRDEHGAAVALNHDATVRIGRQDLAPQYIEAGSVYAMRTAGLLAHGHRFFGRVAIYEIPRERAVEIDEEGDFALAEARLLAANSVRR